MTTEPTSFSADRTATPPSGERDRNRIPEKYTWNLRDLYSDDAAWRREKEGLRSRIPDIATFRGTLADSGARLLECLRFADELSKEFMRLSAYAGMHFDENTRDSGYLAMQAEMSQVGSTFSSAASFIEPEILAAGADTIARLLAAEEGLSVYRHYLDDLRRREAHTGTSGEERIIAEAGLLAEGPGDIYSIFTNADFPYPRVALDSGREVTLNPSVFAVHRASPSREERR
ncbi:MAG TPA: oligoendopeptidase F, partial [Bacteroidota bacterium]|nr:oligoendopeptidase F [Bacteroidota bacterium]